MTEEERKRRKLEGIKLLEKIPMPEQEPEVRARNFKEVPHGYTAEMAVEEAWRCIQCKNSPCVQGCPVEIDIPAFVRAIQEEKFQEAVDVIKRTNALPAVCGRVCPQEEQCEKLCVRGKKGMPVAIGRLERFAADWEAEGGEAKVPEIAPPNGHKVAIIGCGPGGMTCAGDLALLGYEVHVYEAFHASGGVLRYGIPEFRLPKDVVCREIHALGEQEVDLKLNWVGGKSVTIQDLFDQGFKAVFVGVGAGLPKFMRMPGEDLVGVFSANEYLTRVNLGRAYEFPKHDTPIIAGKKVVVIGGGNVAMDAARTAVRLGAEDVRVIYRRERAQMPARVEEIDHAVEEGVFIQCLHSPLELLGDEQGNLVGIRLQLMQLGEPDESGRCRPLSVEGAVVEQECDLAIIAVGTGPNKVLLDATPELALNEWGYVTVDEKTGETNIPNVFAGGDVVTGAATVISAMGAGRRAAKEITRRLLGEEYVT